MRSTRNRGADPSARWHRPVRLVMAALTAVLVALAGPLATTSGAAPEVDDPPTAAAWGAEWLAKELGAGIPFETFGSPDWGTTLDAALALVAVDGHQALLDEVWAQVEAQRESIVTASGADVPGRLAQVILLAVGLGEDPTSVGAAPGEDLVARLEDTRTTAGPDEGLFGSQDATYDGAYRQGYSLAALVAAGVTPDPTAVQWLLDQQCDDGSWMPHRTDLSEPCAFDGGAFVGPDTNSTALAISGLIAAGAGGEPAVADALAWLDSVQNDDGGWGFFPGDGSDPNSTAVVVMALRSAGVLDDPEFDDRAGSPLESLLSFQLACAAGADAGAFTFPGSGDLPNTMATAQGTSAAAGATLGITGPLVTVSFEDPCPPTTTTTTTTTTSTTTTSTVPVGGPPDGSAGDDPPGGADPVPDVADLASERAGGGGGRSGSLARTGTEASHLASVGAALLLLGAAVSLTASRRRRA